MNNESFSDSSEELLHTTIWGPKSNEKINYKWNKTTATLGTLLNNIIKAFHLESVKHECIRLVTISDTEIDLVKNSHIHLSSLGLKNNSTIWIKLIDFPHNQNISSTDTIPQSTKQIENGHYIVQELCTETNEKDNSNNIIGSSIMNPPRNEVRRPVPIINQHKVIVKCKLSSSKTVNLTASIMDTVAELTERIASYNEDQQLAQVKLRSLAIVINDPQSKLSLADFGIKQGSTIEATIHNVNPSSHSVKSEPVVSLYASPIGLKNQNNSCFMNSALQCLVHVMPLTRYFLESIDRTHRNIKNPFDSYGEVTGAYAELLYKLQATNDSNNAFVPYRLREAISCHNPSFATGDQQDAQEFLIALLDTIHEELHSKKKPSQKTIIEKLFFGEIQSMITCLECNNVKTKIEKLQFLSLQLSRQQREFTIEFCSKKDKRFQSNIVVLASGRIGHLVKAFLDKYKKSDRFDRIIVQTTTSKESLDFNSPLDLLLDSNLRLIEQKEPVIRTPSSQLGIDINSNEITLDECLREFFSIEYIENPWLCKKKQCRQNPTATKQLQFHTLPPILVIQLKRFASDNRRQKKIKIFVKYPIDGLDLSAQSTSRDAIYDLIAVSNHRGSIHDGHYTAYARQSPTNHQWYKFDDDAVSIISSNSEIVTANAYLLFYMKRNYPD